MPLVSVITTVYNCEKYIRESMNSILHQTLDDLEYIVINDGSTDRTADVIRDIRDDRVRFFDHDDNRYISARTNEAIAAATGEFIAIQDGDDISLPTRLEKQVALLRRRPDLFGVGSHAVQIDADGNKLGLLDFPPLEHDAIVRAIRTSTSNPLIHPSITYRRREFLELVRYYPVDPVYYFVLDFDVFARAVDAGLKLANLAEPLVAYRRNPAGHTANRKIEMIHAHALVQRRSLEKDSSIPRRARARLWSKTGRRLLRYGEIPRAIEWLDLAIKLNPLDIRARWNVAQARWSLKSR